MARINMDVVVDCPESEIDMQFGLETLKGTSDVISIAAETILRERVPDKRTHKSDVRTRLKNTFTGSYGQKFSIEVKDRALQGRLRKIGSDTFLEVLCYFVMEALYIDAEDLSKDAEELVEQLSEVSDRLTDRLREPLVDMHKMATYFGYGIRVRHRKRGAPEPKQLLMLNKGTAKNITEAVRSDQEEDIEVVIVRFHSITGNGRFYIKKLQEIESFGFESKVNAVREQIRKSISENLHKNNTVNPENGALIKLRVKKVSLPTGKVIKYLISGVFL